MPIISKKIVIQDDLFEFIVDDTNMYILNQKEYNKLYKYYKPKIKKLISVTLKKLKYLHGVSSEDLMQELSYVLFKNIIKYDETKAKSFNTLFWISCKNKLKDILRKTLHTRAIKSETDTITLDILNKLNFPISLEDEFFAQQEDVLIVPEHVLIHTIVSKILQLNSF